MAGGRMFPGMVELILMLVIIGGFVAIAVIMTRRDTRAKKNPPQQ